jgi:hypothetical protein
MSANTDRRCGSIQRERGERERDRGELKDAKLNRIYVVINIVILAVTGIGSEIERERESAQQILFSRIE